MPWPLSAHGGDLPAGPAELRGNHIVVPVTSAYTAQYGGAALGGVGVFAADPTLLVTNNLIEGDPAPLKTTGQLRVGLDFLWGACKAAAPTR